MRCDFGCDRIATHTLKNGKKCCSEKFQQCPAFVERMKSGLRKSDLQKNQKCNFCGNLFKRVKKHVLYCKLNPDRKEQAYSWKQGHIPWNKGISTPGIPHTEETKRKMSRIAKKNGNGGYIRGSGRGKRGWYRGIWCDSSWELAYVIFCLEHDISIKRSKRRLSYTHKGQQCTYVPDFEVNGKVVEIKGVHTKKWDAKHKANPSVTVLFESDLKEVFEYVHTKYGSDFIRLYDGDDPAG